MQRRVRAVAPTALFFVFLSSLFGQGSSGTISGRVVDPTGMAVAGASVKLQNQTIQDSRTFTTTQSGDFLFADVQPGTYSISVKAAGFKQFDKTGLQLNA